MYTQPFQHTSLMYTYTGNNCSLSVPLQCICNKETEQTFPPYTVELIRILMQYVTPCRCLGTTTCLDCIHSNKQPMGGKGNSGHRPTQCHGLPKFFTLISCSAFPPLFPPPCSPTSALLSLLFPSPLSSSRTELVCTYVYVGVCLCGCVQGCVCA